MSKSTKLLIPNEVCEKILRKCFGNEVKLVDSKLTLSSDTICGYLGEYYKLYITYCFKSSYDDCGTTTFFVKSMPCTNANQANFVKSMGVFKKEVLMYENLINVFLKLCSKPFTSTSYFSEPDKYLILEDLSAKGFKVSKSNYLTIEQCKSFLGTLARFHASTLIFEELRSKNIIKYRIGNYFKEELAEGTFSFTEGHPRQKWCKTTSRCVADLIEIIANGKPKNKIRNEFMNIVEYKMPKYIAPSEQFRNVCTHDDLWCNNIMFNECLDAVMIDFQLTRYSPPGFDVLLFLVINLDNESFIKNKHDLLSLYYKILSNELEAHNIQPDKILSKAEFMESIDYYYLPALIEAAMYGTNVYVEKELQEKILSDQNVFNEFMFMDRSKHVIPEFHENKSYRDRLNQILVPLAEYVANNIK